LIVDPAGDGLDAGVLQGCIWNDVFGILPVWSLIYPSVISTMKNYHNSSRPDLTSPSAGGGRQARMQVGAERRKEGPVSGKYLSSSADAGREDQIRLSAATLVGLRHRDNECHSPVYARRYSTIRRFRKL
jgi:hypothetical protein